MPSGLAAGLVAPVPDHRQQARDRIRLGYAPAEHVAVDVRRDDQACGPVRDGAAGTRPEPPRPPPPHSRAEESPPPRAPPTEPPSITPPRPGPARPPPPPRQR